MSSQVGNRFTHIAKFQGVLLFNIRLSQLDLYKIVKKKGIERSTSTHGNCIKRESRKVCRIGNSFIDLGNNL
uniref:Putative ovule protein n=1 Tax=Solanum chacoense TaxID=4108 RepID=A0A0V0H7S4_SOLCH